MGYLKRLVMVNSGGYQLADVLLDGHSDMAGGQGVGKTTAPFFYNIIGMWGVRILGTFICTQVLGYGLVSAWACMIGHNLLLFVFFTLHYRTGRWDPWLYPGNSLRQRAQS